MYGGIMSGYPKNIYFYSLPFLKLTLKLLVFDKYFQKIKEHSKYTATKQRRRLFNVSLTQTEAVRAIYRFSTKCLLRSFKTFDSALVVSKIFFIM